MKPILHVIVGAGIPVYMENCVQSVLAKSPDDVLGIYNYLNSKDQREVAKLELKFDETRFSLQLQPNEVATGLKTGSLYSAYNSAIDSAVGRYELIHFIQADMQMMCWDAEVVTTLRSLFEQQPRNQQAKLICVGTSFHSRGRWTEDYAKNNLVLDDGVKPCFAYRGVSMSDAGVFNLSEIQANNIRFQGTEAEMQERLRQMGYEMKFLNSPVMSFVPWPATVRNGTVVARGRLDKYSSLPLLEISPEYPFPDIFEATKPEIFWMEDWVQPNGWVSLWPYWLSDTASPKWLVRRLTACRELGVGLLSRTGRSQRKAGRRVPGFGELVWALLVWSQKRVLLALSSSIRHRLRSSRQP